MSRKFRLSLLWTSFAFMLLILTMCKGAEMSSVQSGPEKMENIPQAAWDSLSQKRIYFGHQSVGNNILDGIRDIMQRNPDIKLNLKETSDPAAFREPVFAHSPIGKNRDPLLKIDHFRKIVESGIGEKADIAFFKFCYVDIDSRTDVEALVRAYDETIQDLRTRFSKLTIPVVTAPLTALPAGLKTSIKKLLGRGEPDKADNIKRNAFNAHLREKYGKLVFDLAALESTRPDGQRTFFVEGTGTFYALDPAYTDDGGHLNSSGRWIVVAGLLRFLAELGPRP